MKKAKAKKTPKLDTAADPNAAQVQQSHPPASTGSCTVCGGKNMKQVPPDGRRSTMEGRRFRCETCNRTTKRKLTEVARG